MDSRLFFICALFGFAVGCVTEVAQPADDGDQPLAWDNTSAENAPDEELPPTNCPMRGACPLQNGLVANYLFEEFSAGTASVARNDSSDCAHHLFDPTYVASTATAHSGLFAARNLNAEDNFLTRTDSRSLSVFHAGRSFTVAAWFQIAQEPTTGGRALFMKGTKVGASPVREFAIEHQPAGSSCGGSQEGTNHIHVAVFDQTLPGAAGVTLDVPNTNVDPNGFDPTASVGQWQFVIAWHDNTTRTLSIQLNNGTVYSISTAAMTIRNTTAPLVLGGKDFGTGKNWDGIYDEVAIWNRILTPSERSSVFSNGVVCP